MGGRGSRKERGTEGMKERERDKERRERKRRRRERKGDRQTD